MPTTNHAATIGVIDMLANRLTFLDFTDSSLDTLSSNFIAEAMHELNVCLSKEDAQVGNEANYSFAEKSLLADVVAVQLLMNQSIKNIYGTVGNVTDVNAVDKFVKSAGAGSAKVEFEQVDNKKSSSKVLGLDTLIDMYRSAAVRKGHKLGCDLVFLENGGLEISCGSCDPVFVPFCVVTDSDNS